MTTNQMAKEAMEYNRCAIIARKMGKLPATVAGLCDRRDFIMKTLRDLKK